MATYPELGRRCAVCGRGQTPRLGGLAGFAWVIASLRQSGTMTLKLPDSRYAHPKCLTHHPEETTMPTMTKMTRSHFQFIADIIADLPPVERKAAALLFASRLKATNPQFRRDYFLDACNVQEEG